MKQTLVAMGLALAICGTSGCVLGRASWGIQSMTANHWDDRFAHAPGPIVAAPPPPAPALATGPLGVGGAGQVWVEGHYAWVNGNYQWIPGHWERPPQPGWEWQQPAWVNNQWHQGYWHPRAEAIPNPYFVGNGAWNPQVANATPVGVPRWNGVNVPGVGAPAVAVPVNGAATQVPVGVLNQVPAMATPVQNAWGNTPTIRVR